MSATNRGAKRSENDFYRTPEYATRAILPMLEAHGAMRGRILEPGCGSGAIGAVLRDRWPHTTVTGVELDNRFADSEPIYNGGFYLGNYLADSRPWRSGTPYTLAIANPPFKLMLEFVERMMADVDAADGVVAVLSRIGWLAGARAKQPARKRLLRTRPPFVGILERRPSFGNNQHGKKGTDGTEYVWLVWNAGLEGTWEILDCEQAREPKVADEQKPKTSRKAKKSEAA